MELATCMDHGSLHRQDKKTIDNNKTDKMVSFGSSRAWGGFPRHPAALREHRCPLSSAYKTCFAFLLREDGTHTAAHPLPRPRPRPRPLLEVVGPKTRLPNSFMPLVAALSCSSSCALRVASSASIFSRSSGVMLSKEACLFRSSSSRFSFIVRKNSLSLEVGVAAVSRSTSSARIAVSVLLLSLLLGPDSSGTGVTAPVAVEDDKAFLLFRLAGRRFCRRERGAQGHEF
mmetsp:Transcript_25111/g.78775  ORF Transcript_25111/g.78775 Transcript_25111/m.78775 type:complete len:230 (-) Transcript_25111:195-884(-)